MARRPNIINVLLGFASDPRPQLEDPFTEILAWLLDQEPSLLSVFVGLLQSSLRGRGLDLQPSRYRVSTQVVVPRATGVGICRYDLVLDSASTRLVIEVKVISD